MGISTWDEDFEALKDTGLLADLSGSEIIRELTNRLRPELKALVTTEDGKILGVPDSSYPDPLYWRQDAFDAAELGAEDVPQSYTELLDFLEKWAERVKVKPEKNVCVAAYAKLGGGPAKYNYWLLDVLIETWEMQSHYKGIPLNFDTPEFIALLKRTREVGIQLYKVEPNGKKRENMLQLFENNALGSWNNSRDYGLFHTVPYRITRDQPMLMKNYASIYMIREGSQWTEECITALEDLLSQDDRTTVYYADMYGDIGPGEYVFHDGSTSVVTAGYLKDFETYEGIITYPVTRTGFQYESLIPKFKDGDIKAEKFAAEISKPKRDPNK